MAAKACFEVSIDPGGDRFYVLANDAEAAIEQAKDALGLTGGSARWKAVSAPPALTLVAGVVFDAAGRPIKRSAS